MKEKCSECGWCNPIPKTALFFNRDGIKKMSENFCSLFSCYILNSDLSPGCFVSKEERGDNEEMKDIYFEEEKTAEVYEETFIDYFYSGRSLPPHNQGIFF